MLTLHHAAVTTAFVTRTLELSKRVQQAFDRVGFAQLRQISSTAEGDAITLTGQLDSPFLKQTAQDIAANVPGVRQVKNLIKVVAD